MVVSFELIDCKHVTLLKPFARLPILLSLRCFSSCLEDWFFLKMVYFAVFKPLARLHILLFLSRLVGCPFFYRLAAW